MTQLQGKRAPNFTLQNTEGEHVTLSEIIGSDNIILLFFPLAFSPTCTDEMCKMRDDMKLYRSLNAKIIGISVDSFFTLKEFKRAKNLNFTLLSDFNKGASRKYHVLYDEFFGMKGVSKRAVFIINEEGSIVYEEVLDNAGNLPDFASIQEVLQ
jgi:peroxiredoxin